MDASPEYNRFMDHLLFRSLKGDTAPAEEEKVREWRRASADNESYFQELARLLELTARAYGPDQKEIGNAPAPGTLIRARSHGDAAAGGDGGAARFASRPRWMWWLGGGLAAALMLVALGLNARLDILNLPPSFRAREFVTGSRESANVVLTDGTVIRLAGDTRLQVLNERQQRAVTLTGRAYFTVADDPDRPFSVKLATGDVRVHGTRFAIDASTDDLRVVVMEGTVSLAAAGTEVEVKASEMARVVRGAALPVVRLQDPTKMASWIGNFLAFQDTPLSRAAKEIEQAYNIRIEIRDSTLARRTVTAWFADQAADEVIEIICIIVNARCETSGVTVRMEPNPWDDR